MTLKKTLLVYKMRDKNFIVDVKYTETVNEIGILIIITVFCIATEFRVEEL